MAHKDQDTPVKSPKKGHIDLTGQRYGRLTVVSFATRKNRALCWHVHCDCGTDTVVRGASLRNGVTKSCGCIADDLNQSRVPEKKSGESREEKRARIESKSYLDKRFIYDPHTGILTWKVMFPGRTAGTITRSGVPFVKLHLEKLDFKAHRLIWVMQTGERPSSKMHIDHIDGNPLNNKWDNLRICDAKRNCQNSKKPRNNSTGYKGVSMQPDGKYRAYIVQDRKQINLGRFEKIEDAALAYQEAAKRLFGEYACLDR